MLSKKVLMYRNLQGISQNKISQICNLPRTTYREIENGKNSNPTLVQTCKLCRGFNITPNDLIPEEFWK